MEKCAALFLNVIKTVFVPLWRAHSIAVEALLRQKLCDRFPTFAHAKIAPFTKYLGYFLGPGATDEVWAGPLRKFLGVISTMTRAGLPASFACSLWGSRGTSLVRYVGALVLPPTKLLNAEGQMLNRLLKYPGRSIQAGHALQLHLEGPLKIPGVVDAAFCSLFSTAFEQPLGVGTRGSVYGGRCS